MPKTEPPVPAAAPAAAAPAAAAPVPTAPPAAPAEPLATSSNGSWLSAFSNPFGSNAKSPPVIAAEKKLAESRQKAENDIKAAEAAVEAAKKLPALGGKRKNRNRNKNSKKKNKTGGKKPRNGNRKTIRK